MGIHNTYLRQKILMCAEETVMRTADGAPGAVPSAPVPDDLPSAPPAAKVIDEEEPAAASAPKPSAPPLAPVDTFKSTECVVCMENRCDIIFLPCGHVCCCFKCEKDIAACPLCRASIAQKVRLYGA